MKQKNEHMNKFLKFSIFFLSSVLVVLVGILFIYFLAFPLEHSFIDTIILRFVHFCGIGCMLLFLVFLSIYLIRVGFDQFRSKDRVSIDKTI
ncbi:hypothetical protein DBR43_09925 [Pedobacter sp. KBW06]|nr:hypothetical protein DBR43_09925 [Pedobacter sp. KBW06]